VTFRNFVVLVTLLAYTTLIACTSMRPIEDFSPSKIREQVHVGDRASVVYGSSGRYDITVTAVDADALHGVTDAGNGYKFPFEKIRAIDVERTSKGKTTAVVVPIAVTAFIILLIRSLKWGGDPGSADPGSGNGGGD